MALQLVTKEFSTPSDQLTTSEAARKLAEFHREIAARMPLGSNRKGLVLRNAKHWESIGYWEQQIESREG
jgi:hypothetical protein